MKEFSYSSDNKLTAESIANKLASFLGGETPIVVCIGTDAAIGDSVGPLCGTMLKKRIKDTFVYGSLSSTVTAKEIAAIKTFLSEIHPLSKIVVVDAAVGSPEDVGYVKISDSPIKPGLGANKDLPALGDVSIIAIVGAKTKNSYELLSSARLSYVYNLAKIVADGIEKYVASTMDKELAV